MARIARGPPEVFCYFIIFSAATQPFLPAAGKFLLFLRRFYAVNALSIWLIASANTSKTSKRTAVSFPARIKK